MKAALILIGILPLAFLGSGCFLAAHKYDAEYSRCPENWTYERPYTPTGEDTLFESAWSDLGYRPCFIDSALQRWHRESLPINAAELATASDTVRAIYEFFRDYYLLDSQYRVPEFVVLQGSVSYAVLDSARYSSYCSFDSGVSGDIQEQFEWRHLTDFHPAIKAEGIKIVYLSPARVQTLNYFFNGENGYEPCLRPCIDRLEWSILRSKEEELSKLIPLVEQHWCIGFNYRSFPVLLSIAFSGDLRHAKINTMQGFNSGEYLEYVRIDSEWTKVNHRITRQWMM